MTAPPPGRFVDQLVECETCGRTFVFTVEEQRRLADAGLPVVAPTQCSRCAPRTEAASPPSSRPEPSRPPQPVPPIQRPSEPVARVAPLPARPRPAASATAPPPVARRQDDEFDIQFTVRSFGHVKSYDAERGYGFIIDDDTNEEYYVHHSGLEGARTLTAGQAVEFETTRKGRETQAVHVIIL